VFPLELFADGRHERQAITKELREHGSAGVERLEVHAERTDELAACLLESKAGREFLSQCREANRERKNALAGCLWASLAARLP
jgi:hypothetical protein